MLSGTVYRAIVKDGIDGTTAFDADFASQTADALAFTESSANAATVTINTTRYSYGVPGLSFLTVGTFALVANTDYYMPFIVTRPLVVDMIGFESGTGPASAATVHQAVYAATDDLQPSGSPLITVSQSLSTSATGVFRNQVTPVTLQPGSYLLVLNTSVAFTVRRMYGGFPSNISAAVGTSPFDVRWTASRTSAAYSGSLSPFTTRTVNNTGFEYHLHLRWKAAS